MFLADLCPADSLDNLRRNYNPGGGERLLVGKNRFEINEWFQSLKGVGWRVLSFHLARVVGLEGSLPCGTSKLFKEDPLEVGVIIIT